MITSRPYGVSPKVSITIDGVQVDYRSINVIDIHMDESSHDTAIFEMSGIPPRAITDYYNAPVSIALTYGLHYSHTFIGRVAEVKPESMTSAGLVNGSPFQKAQIVCMGASYEMRGDTSKIWRNYSMTDVAENLAHKYGFSLDVPSTDVVYDNNSQTNESDWKFLVRLVKSMGYEVNVHGTHMHVYDPYSAASRATSYHVLTTLRKSRQETSPVPGQIFDFKGSFSERNSDGQYSQTSVSVIDDSGKVYDVNTKDVNQSTYNGRYSNRVSGTFNSFAEARRAIDADRRSVYDYVADVRVNGLAGCVPGGVVRIDNYNSDFDGLWYVKGVHHRVHSDAFYTELKVARNIRSNLEVYNYKPFDTPPESRYSGIRWESTKQVTNVYA